MHRKCCHTYIFCWLVLIHSHEYLRLWWVWRKTQRNRIITLKMIQKQQRCRVDETFPLNSFLIISKYHLFSVVIACKICDLNSIEKMFVLKWASHRNIQNNILPQRVIWDKDIHRPFRSWWKYMGNFFCWTSLC